MIDQIAYSIGYIMLVLGGALAALLSLALLGWAAFDIISRRMGWTKMILEWREAKRRELLGG